MRDEWLFVIMDAGCDLRGNGSNIVCFIHTSDGKMYVGAGPTPLEALENVLETTVTWFAKGGMYDMGKAMRQGARPVSF